MSVLAETFVKVGFDPSGLNRGLAAARTSLIGSATSMGRAAGTALSSAFTVGATAGLATLAGGAFLVGYTTKLASNAEEAGTKFGFVFGKAADKTAASLDIFAKAAGRSKFEMRAAAGDIGALLQPMGLAADKTGEMSAGFAILASDLASFFNASDADAMTALKAGVVGESEPLRRFGITLSEGKIQAEAFAMGIARTKEQVTGAVKAQAIYNLVMRESKVAQGDAIRTSGGFANSLRGLQGSITDLGTEIGQLFVPAAAEINKFLRSGIEYLRENTAQFEEWGKTVGEIVRNVLAQVGELSKSWADSFGTGLNGFIAQLTGGEVKSFSDMVSQLLDQTALLTADFDRTWKFLETAGDLAITQLAAGFVSGLQTIKAVFTGGFALLPSIVQDAAGGIIDGLDSILNFARGMFLQITAGFDAMVDGMITRFNEIRGFLEFLNPTLKLLPGLKTGGPGAGDAIRAGMPGIDKEINIREIGTSFDNILDAAGKGLAERLHAIGLDLANQLQGMAGARAGRNAAANPAPGLPPINIPSWLSSAFTSAFTSATSFNRSSRYADDGGGVASVPVKGGTRIESKDSDADIHKFLKESGMKIDFGELLKDTIKDAGAGLGGMIAGGGRMAGELGNAAADALGEGAGAAAKMQKTGKTDFVGFADLNKKIQMSLGDDPAKKTAKNTDATNGLLRQLLGMWRQVPDAIEKIPHGLAKGAGVVLLLTSLGGMVA